MAGDFDGVDPKIIEQLSEGSGMPENFKDACEVMDAVLDFMKTLGVRGMFVMHEINENDDDRLCVSSTFSPMMMPAIISFLSDRLGDLESLPESEA